MKLNERKTKLKKDDEVIVIAGSEKGKRGKVLQIDLGKEKVFVQGIKKIKKFQRPSQENPKGGILEIEAGINLANVMFYDSKTKKGVRLGYKQLEGGKKVRVIRPEGREV
jgi:large subunit ribosomal protein L24